LKSASAEILQSYYQDFGFFLSSQSGREARRKIRERTEVVKPPLTEEHIDILTKEGFDTIVRGLRSFAQWKDKESRIQRLLEDSGGVEPIREGLRHLLYERWEAADLYDDLGAILKGFDHSVLTEILALVFPDRYCFWDDRSTETLRFLRLDGLVSERVFRGEMTGADYLRYVEATRLIKAELETSGLREAEATETRRPDFWTVTLFAEYISDQVLKMKRFPTKQPLQIVNSSPQTASTIRVGFLWGLVQGLTIGLVVIGGWVTSAQGFGFNVYPVVTLPFWWLFLPLSAYVGYHLADTEKTVRAILVALTFTFLFAILLLTILPSPLSSYAAQGQLTFYGTLSLVVFLVELTGSIPGAFVRIWWSEKPRETS